MTNLQKTIKYVQMIAEYGRYVVAVRRCDANESLAGVAAARRELLARARAASRFTRFRNSAGSARARDGRSRRSAQGGAYAAFSNRPPILCPSGAGGLPPATPRPRNRPSPTGRRPSPAASPRRKTAVTLTSRSKLSDVARVVGGALADAGIPATLSGGACATIYSEGAYQSLDLDFILGESVSRKRLDKAMSDAGFKRSTDHYIHARTKFFVEFPRGPLAIGRDAAIRPVKIQLGRIRIAALSATDSCRDRLAAFYFWSDRSSLEAAVAIASRRRVALGKIRRWSEGEGHAERFGEFHRQLRSVRRRPSRSTASSS